MADYKTILKQTFKFEGGYQNDSTDDANYNSKHELIGTNRGISGIALEQYWKETGRGGIPKAADVKAITPALAEKIYKKLFWDKINGDKIRNQAVAWIIFDAYIASGNNGLERIRESVNKYFNKKVLAETASSLKSADVDTINKANQYNLFGVLKENEIAHRKSLAKSNPAKYAKNLQGWLNRLDKIEYLGEISNPVAVINKVWNNKILFLTLIVVGVAGAVFIYYGYVKNKNQ